MHGIVCRVLVIMILLLCSIPARAAAPAATLQEVVSTLETGYGELADLQASFSQRTTISAIKRVEKGTGELLLKKGKGGNPQFRFNYTKPKQQIVCDGKTLWFYQQDGRQVLESDAAAVFSGGNAIAMSYLTGLGRISQDFTARFAGEVPDRQGNYTLELVPKKNGTAVAKLLLTVSGEAVAQYRADGKPRLLFPVVSSVLYDLMGNQTAIDYSGIKVNRGISSDRFSFKVPTGVQVIKSR